MDNLKSKTCCFTGHRRIASYERDHIYNKLKNEIISHIKKGVIYFVAGGALGFDTLAALAVLELKQLYNNIQLILILPCENQTNGWSKKNIDIYENIKLKADKVVIVTKEYTRDCMHMRNRRLVDNSNYCICYYNGQKGGTAYTVNYA